MPAILLAEDNDGLARIYTRYLETNGYEVRWVTHGSQALAAMAQSHPDMVIMDLVLPDASGVALTREFRAMGYRGPVLAISGDILPSSDEGVEFVDVLMKPLRLAQLLEVVQSCIGVTPVSRES